MKRIAIWLAVLIASLAASAAGAQQYPAKFASIIKTEIGRWAQVVKRAGVKLE